MAKIIMVQGTMSNAGKSLIVAGLCRIFAQDGYRVAPFKSQNMALNSYITEEGLEMGRAQVMQAEAAGIKPLVCMNPILLKPTNQIGSQVIVNGEVLGNMSAKDYFRYKKSLIPEIKKAFQTLEKQADIIVIEGAGSPAEINLRENDIVNMGLAELLDAPVILVGDIDRGGVFAQLLGTISLLTKAERARVGGLVINKFRGDKSILDPGIVMLEEKGKIPVVGVVPYMQIAVEDEDSLSTCFDNKQKKLIDLAVIHYPRISNFTDLSVFEQMDAVSIRYVKTAEELSGTDMIVLPGSKNTMADLKWMRQSGLEAAVKKAADSGTPVFGICGGYQMLGDAIADPYQVEEGGSIRGMELLPILTELLPQKTRTQVRGHFMEMSGILEELSGMEVSGYEIHMGHTVCTEKGLSVCELREMQHSAEDELQSREEWEYDRNSLPEKYDGLGRRDASGKMDGFCRENVYGTYVHGIFDAGRIAETIVQLLARKKGVTVDTSGVMDYRAFKETQYDLLAENLRKSLDMEKIYGMLRESRIHGESCRTSIRGNAEESQQAGKREAAVQQMGAFCVREKLACLENIRIMPPDASVSAKIQENWDRVAKPLDGLGEFEKLLARIGAILGDTSLDIRKKAIIAMCADNGVVEEGISQSGQEVTAIVTEFMGKNETSVGRMARSARADVIPVDIGIAGDQKWDGVRNYKVRKGTRNFSREPAMTVEELNEAVSVGIHLVKECKEKGYRLIGTGEMGIGNTTTSSAVAAALLDCEVSEITGRGAGLSDAGLSRKKQVIRDALCKYQFEKEDTVRILRTVGGLDIAGLCGVYIGGARYQIPIVMDGVISAVAALAAERLCPGVRQYLIPSHKSKEPAAQRIMEELSVKPVIDAGLALGEGTGAVMMFSLLDLALTLYQDSTTFGDIEVAQYERFLS